MYRFPFTIFKSPAQLGTQRIVGILARWGSIDPSLKYLRILKNKGRKFPSVLNNGTALVCVLWRGVLKRAAVERASFTLEHSPGPSPPRPGLSRRWTAALVHSALSLHPWSIMITASLLGPHPLLLNTKGRGKRFRTRERCYQCWGIPHAEEGSGCVRGMDVLLRVSEYHSVDGRGVLMCCPAGLGGPRTSRQTLFVGHNNKCMAIKIYFFFKE